MKNKIEGLLNGVVLITGAVLILSNLVYAQSDPLSSWNNTDSKKAIIEFVEKVTERGSPDFVSPAERIATFDNDGTLWSEQPIYFQFAFAMDRVVALADKNPQWKNQQPFKAVLEKDMEALAAAGEKGLIEIIMATHAGLTTDAFTAEVIEWLETARHPSFKRPYTELVFQPMLELLEYLRVNDFKTYIVSGGGIEFMRPWTERVYGIPPEQVVGSSIKTNLEIRDGTPVLVRIPEVNFIDDKAGKPVGIKQHIGRRPIAAFGNSDGDFQMLQWTAAGKGLRFMLLVHHTDDQREWAYDRQSHIGRLDQALDHARDNSWTIVDMKKDWKVIYPFQLK